MRTLLLACLAALLAVSLRGTPAAAQGGPPKPGPEHEMLKKFEGQWNATVTGPGGESKATASYKVGLGGFWLQLHFKGDFAGTPFEGRGITGYDPLKKKYVSSWADSMEPHLTLMEGAFDKEGKTFTETGEATGMDGKATKMKSVYEFKDKDTIVFTMYRVEGGKDEQMFQITYKRKEK
jgi:hypothetical protein